MESLNIIKTKNFGTVIHPKNQLFKQRLQPLKFNDLYSNLNANSEFKQKIRKEIETEGLLNPMVVMPHERLGLMLQSGSNRLKILKNLADASIVYMCKDENEVKFFSYLNNYIWKFKPDLNNLDFCFAEGEDTRRLKKCAERVKYLFEKQVIEVETEIVPMEV
tara:strand:+ start:112 stop:600 length:489 start_codon:yes stop_codon:yes gene_type:complete